VERRIKRRTKVHKGVGNVGDINYDIFRQFEEAYPDNYKPEVYGINVMNFSKDVAMEVINIFIGKNTIKKFKNLNKIIEEIFASYDIYNSYHNAFHAADVVQTVYQFIKNSNICSDKVLDCTDYDKLDIILAAAGHDYAHTAVGDKSQFKFSLTDPILNEEEFETLEEYHATKMEKLLIKYKDEFPEDYKSSFSDHIYLIKGMISATFAGFDKANLGHLDLIKESLRGDKEKKKNFLGAILHAADISNPLKSKELYYKWSLRVGKELFQSFNECVKKITNSTNINYAEKKREVNEECLKKKKEFLGLKLEDKEYQNLVNLDPKYNDFRGNFYKGQYFFLNYIKNFHDKLCEVVLNEETQYCKNMVINRKIVLHNLP
jgi:hypothetical protein